MEVSGSGRDDRESQACWMIDGELTWRVFKQWGRELEVGLSIAIRMQLDEVLGTPGWGLGWRCDEGQSQWLGKY